MSSNQHPLCFLELTDFSYRFAVCPDRQHPLKIQEIHEFPLTETNRLEKLFPPNGELICALRAKTRQAHLASTAQASEFKGVAGLQAFARLPDQAAAQPAWFAGVQASDGQVPTEKPWLLSLSPEGAHQQARSLIAHLKPASTRYLDATIITAGSLRSLVTTPTLLLEIGELSSQAFLVSKQGVLAAHTVTLNLDQIAEAVQAEFNLKFRGSAAKLFFNPDCDFSDHASQIAGRVVVSLKRDLTPLLTGQPAPTALCCSGLPAAQHWFAVALAQSLTLAPFVPPAKSPGTANNVSFATPAMESSLPPAWFNFLNLIKAQSSAANGGSPWLAEWQSIQAPLSVTITPTAKSDNAAQVETTLVTGRAATPASSPVSPIAPTPAAATTAPAAAATAAAPAPKPTASVSAPAPTKSATPAVVHAPAPVKKTSAASPSPAVKPAAQPAPLPAPATSPAEPSRRSRAPLMIGLAAVVVAALAGGFFYSHSQAVKAEAEAARIAQEKQATELRLQAEAEKARLAEEQRLKEANSRKLFEFETTQKLAAAEAARQQAENEARQQTAARLASARGNLVITTEPAGALVAVGDLPASPSPVTHNYLKIGRYPVTITLPRHDPVTLQLEVTENGTTNPGVISLTRIAGALEITSDPAGTRYELQPANAPAFSIAPKLTGTTPATLTDLEPGDYTVTYTRAGWDPHTENITVARDGTARTQWTAPHGQIQITSDPAGATVSHNGRVVGRTPLTLAEPPGTVRYDLALSGYEPAVLTGRAEGGKPLALTTRLLALDRLYGSNDLDVRPEPIKPQMPELPEGLLQQSARIEIQLTVTSNGTPKDIKLVKSDNAAVAALYLEALAKWKFKPGQKAGKPVNSRVLIPFVVTYRPPGY